MERAEVIAKLRAHEAELKRMGVRHLYLFGSITRDEAREDSDVDLFFDYDRGELSLFDVMDLKERASAILGREAGIRVREHLPPFAGHGDFGPTVVLSALPGTLSHGYRSPKVPGWAGHMGNAGLSVAAVRPG